VTKILVIDDDVEVRGLITEILEQHGFEVLDAPDGRRGVEAFLAERPDLVITDMMMPHKDGIETIMDIHRSEPGAKIMAISGAGARTSFDVLSVARKLGACDTMKKPFKARDLIEHVHHCLTAPS
jgi:DNA-binding response OmpR family regulator